MRTVISNILVSTALVGTISFAGQKKEEPPKKLIEITEQVVVEPEKGAVEAAKPATETEEKVGTEKEGAEVEKEEVTEKREVAKKETVEEEAEAKKKIAEGEEKAAQVEKEIAEAEEKVAEAEKLATDTEEKVGIEKEQVTEKKEVAEEGAVEEETEEKKKVAEVEEKATKVEKEVAGAEEKIVEAEKLAAETEKKVGIEKEDVEVEKEQVVKKEEVTKKETVEEEADVKEKITEVKPTEQITKEVEEIGIDTIDLEEPQGNWLFKRMWWEHAEERYEKIRDLVQKIWESRMNFFIKRTELDKTVLDPFYISMGIGQGELHEILSELVSRIEQEREEEGLLNRSERLLLARLKTEQKTLEQTKFDVESISQLDHDVDEALNRLMEQINRIRAYDREAWEYFKNIARVLNDKKARELFFKMDTVLRNLRDIDEYLQRDFTQHFNQLLQKINEKINEIKSGVQRLKEKGIDFKKQLEDIETVEEEQAVREQEVEKQENEKEMPGWGTRMWNSFVSVIRWPYEKLVGTEEPNE